jgi:hypothetical protein
MPPGLPGLAGIDRLLAWLPLGAQYVVAARKDWPRKGAKWTDRPSKPA